ncbi:MAG: rhamnose ABC transporter substrate-binding protein [Clostridiales Family XIII bacterium]|jgi:rhamnose transport system substrate-binding protein|nr:rhamnose ABC transporter substrate-binding protein [Clostridiales Family XIII bacterium]
MKKRWIAALLICVMVVMTGLAGCGGGGSEEPANEPTETPTEEPADESATEPADEPAPEDTAAVDVAGKKFAIVAKNTGNPYADRENAGFEEAIKEAGGEAIVRAPDQPTAEGQIQILQELIDQGVDSITIVGNDVDALQPVLQQAMDAGIKVSAADSGVNPDSRQVFINQAGTDLIGQTLVDAAFDMCGGEGEFAILSATSQATNQNSWIEAMKKVMEGDEKYAKLNLVEVAYGDDLRDKSVSETEALLQSYPDLKCIVAPTTVGIAAAGKVLTDKNLGGKVALTGLGLPSEMAEYIDNGVCEYMFLWNPIDVGYLAGQTAIALVGGTITGAEGDQYTAGRLGDYTVVKAGDGGTEVILGPPFKFDGSNIAEWKEVY